MSVIPFNATSAKVNPKKAALAKFIEAFMASSRLFFVVEMELDKEKIRPGTVKHRIAAVGLEPTTYGL